MRTPTAPLPHLLPLALAVALAVALASGCKKEEPARGPAPLPPRPTFLQLNQPVQSDPAGIPLKAADGSDVTLGQIATGKVVVLVPWVAPQKDAEERIIAVRDGVKDLQGVQVIPVNVQRAPSEELLSQLVQQSHRIGLPIYVDSEVKLLPFLNAHLPRRTKNTKVMHVPPAALLTNNLRHVALEPPTGEVKADVARTVNGALMASTMDLPKLEDLPPEVRKGIEDSLPAGTNAPGEEAQKATPKAPTQTPPGAEAPPTE